MPQSKKTTTNKKPPVNKKTNSAPSKNWRRWLLTTFLKLSLVFIAFLAAYTLYLDSKVKRKFEGQRWQVPVQVFGMVEQFQRGSTVNLNGIKTALTSAGYQRVTKVKAPGDFAMSANRVIIYRRAFDFGSGVESAQKLTIDIKNGRVTKVYAGNSEAKQVQLEPLLLDRILPESKEDRVLVPLESVPEKLLDTLLIVEDKNFYFHHGVSPLGILRALYSNIKAGRTVQGGSTLTQQLVKNMFLSREKTLTRKLNEAIMALLLELRYSKDQLLEAYINEVYLGQHYANGIYGFGLGSQFYFGKALAQLDNAQMALLIAQIKGPSYYDPWRYPKNALKRRDLVLKLMFKEGVISRFEYEHAVESPIDVRKSRRFAKQKYPTYLQLVKRELAQLLTDQEQESGVRVFTGFSVYSQTLAEQTVTQQLTTLEKSHQQSKLQAALLSTDIQSGEIRAAVGGRESGYAGFNRVLNAKRPIGSLVKPAVFIAAMERFEDYHFATVLEDKAITLTSDSGDAWSPKNYDGKYRGQVSLLEAMIYSLNIPTVNLGMKLGLDKVADAIHLLGYEHDLMLRPSMLLGALNMSPFEVNQLYMAIAAQGHYRQAHAINRIITARGETVWQFDQQPQQRISTQAAYLMDYALIQVTKTGTAKSLSWRLKNKVVAGKTGTSNDERDSWFVGYDANQLVTTWVGRDDNKATNLTGSSGALTLFADYMNDYGIVSKKMEIPDGIALVNFDKNTGRAVDADCQNTVQVPAISSYATQPVSCQQPKKDTRSWFEKIFGE